MTNTRENFIIHTRTNGERKTKIFTAAEIIENAKKQAADGVKPIYRHMELDKRGYLVVSTWDDGAIVVILKSDYPQIRNDYIVTGWQGDFVID